MKKVLLAIVAASMLATSAAFADTQSSPKQSSTQQSGIIHINTQDPY
jgi:opacity protein-like surface antigen